MKRTNVEAYAIVLPLGTVGCWAFCMWMFWEYLAVPTETILRVVEGLGR